tara:strand:- start:7381 stop:8049 length:669 start_codon:yes stop_codon:yes gene_type:complete
MEVQLNFSNLLSAMKKYKKTLFLVLSILFGGSVNAIEEPDYKIIDKNLNFEIRHYEEYLVAEVSLFGDFNSSGSQAFKILAGYIFGDNSTVKKMKMTAPVESQFESTSEKMAMTAPVLSTSEDGKYIYRFVMEKKYSMDTLPAPNDARIRLHKIEPRFMAVKSYSGSWNEKNYNNNKKELMKSLNYQGIQVIGVPIFARYNAPFVPWFLRRNEVMVEIDWPQ